MEQHHIQPKAQCGPGRPREFEEARALAAALDVFWRQGYEATSMDDLTAAMDLSRSSLYGCFGSKRGVLLAAVRSYSDASIATLSEIAASAASPQAAIMEMVGALAQAGGSERGCLMINCITELAPHDEELRDFSRGHMERVEGLIAREIKTFAPREAAARACALVSAALGAVTLRKAGMATERIDAAVAQMKALLPETQLGETS